MAGELKILSRRAGDVIAAARFDEYLAEVAARGGVDPNKALRAYNRPLHLSRVRRIALYLACTAGGCARRAVARGVGLSAEAVAKACREIEEMRDDPAFDRQLDEIELFLMDEEAAA